MQVTLTSCKKVKKFLCLGSCLDFSVFFSRVYAKHFGEPTLLLEHFYLNYQCKLNVDDFNFEILMSNITDPKKSQVLKW